MIPALVYRQDGGWLWRLYLLYKGKGKGKAKGSRSCQEEDDDEDPPPPDDKHIFEVFMLGYVYIGTIWGNVAVWEFYFGLFFGGVDDCSQIVPACCITMSE